MKLQVFNLHYGQKKLRQEIAPRSNFVSLCYFFLEFDGT